MTIADCMAMDALSDIQAELNHSGTLENAAYSCDCTGCSAYCYEACDDGMGPMHED